MHCQQIRPVASRVATWSQRDASLIGYTPPRALQRPGTLSNPLSFCQMAASLGTSALRPAVVRPTPATPTSSPEPSGRWRLPGASSPSPAEPDRRTRRSLHHPRVCVVSRLLHLQYLSIVSTSVAAVSCLKMFLSHSPKIRTQLISPS